MTNVFSLKSFDKIAYKRLALYYFELKCYSTAEFYCELLIAEASNEENKLLFSKILFAQGKHYRAYYQLKQLQSDDARFFLAEVCLKLNKLEEGMQALLTTALMGLDIFCKEIESIVPNGASGFYLLGSICKKQKKLKDARKAYIKALKLDPCLISAYQSLLKLSPDEFSLNDYLSSFNCEIRMKLSKDLWPLIDNKSSTPQCINNSYYPNKCFEPITAHQESSQRNTEPQYLNLTKASKVNEFKTPDLNSHTSSIHENIQQPSKFVSDFEMTDIKNTFGKTSSIVFTPDQIKEERAPANPLHKQKRSMFTKDSRVQVNSSQNDSSANAFNRNDGMSVKNFQLLTESNCNSIICNVSKYSGSNLNANNKNSKGFPEIQAIDNLSQKSKPTIQISNPYCQPFTIADSASEKYSQMRKDNPMTHENISVNINDFQTSVVVLLEVYIKLIYCLFTYNTKEFFKHLQKLPISHSRTSMILNIQGACLFETQNYRDACVKFKEAQTVDPSNTEYVDKFSSCLYARKEYTEICKLANHCVQMGLFSPQTWVVIGNCFSLNKQHENAIMYLQRAIQLNPNYSYPYLLIGHEYLSLDNFAKANHLYSQAINIDMRSYLSWYAKGRLFMREENYEESIKYFNSSIKINPYSPILQLGLAQVYKMNNDFRKAAVCLDKAEEMDKNNQKIKFTKAEILFKNGQTDKAIAILNQLQIESPNEASIQSLLAKIYIYLNDKKQVFTCYNKGLHLDPSESNSLKVQTQRYLEQS